MIPTARIVRLEGRRRSTDPHPVATVPPLPEVHEPWPRPRRRLGLAGEQYDASRADIAAYVASKPWIAPERRLYFVCDQHADPEAFVTSLVASGGVVRTGPPPDAFALTRAGRRGEFVIGGDCLDKGPDNLGLLRGVRHLIDLGAQVEILVGNHDLRTLVGLTYLGRREPHLAHLFVRMGQKSVALFREVHERYVRTGLSDRPVPSDDEARSLLFPGPDWHDRFPDSVRGLIPDGKIEKELVRIPEKIRELLAKCDEVGLTLGQLQVAATVTRELFLEPQGELAWYFGRMRLAMRRGSYLFVHAGLDDVTAGILARSGVEGLDTAFSSLLRENPFELYHGPIGSVFRTKYRDIDFPLTARGVRAIHGAGVHAIVHGHRNIVRGQRIVMRAGILNFECDASVDRNTRRLLGLPGIGAAVTIFHPGGAVDGISVDHPRIKRFHPAALRGLVTTRERNDTVSKKIRQPQPADAPDHEPEAAEPDDERDDADSDDSTHGKVAFERPLSLPEAVAYLEALVSGLKRGKVELRQGSDALVLDLPEHQIDVKVKASRKGKKARLSVRLEWRERGEADLTIVE